MSICGIFLVNRCNILLIFDIINMFIKKKNFLYFCILTINLSAFSFWYFAFEVMLFTSIWANSASQTTNTGMYDFDLLCTLNKSTLNKRIKVAATIHARVLHWTILVCVMLSISTGKKTGGDRELFTERLYLETSQHDTHTSPVYNIFGVTCKTVS